MKSFGERLPRVNVITKSVGAVCMTVGETPMFACSVAHDTYNINHQFNCNDRCLIYITCKHYDLVNLLICQTSKSSNVDEIIIMTIPENFSVLKLACRNIFLETII